MKIRTLAVAVLAAAPFAALPADTNKLAGTWKLVSNINIDAAGKRSDLLGANPVGQAIFTTNGRYVIYLASSNLPKFAANSWSTAAASGGGSAELTWNRIK